MEKVFHTLDPIFFDDSEILILGSMPSPKSRESGFYYAHPQNRFWATLAGVFGEEKPQNVNECISLLFRHNIALWDVLESCDIDGASDASIKNPVPNDLATVIRQTYIHKIFTTGRTAYNLYNRLCKPAIGLQAELLPSPSPANARIKLPELIGIYKAKLQK